MECCDLENLGGRFEVIIQRRKEKLHARRVLDNCTFNAARIVRFRGEILENVTILENIPPDSAVIIQREPEKSFAGR